MCIRDFEAVKKRSCVLSGLNLKDGVEIGVDVLIGSYFALFLTVIQSKINELIFTRI